MSEAASKSVECPRCGKRYTWKLQLAGRKISCSCGRIFDVAASQETEEAPEPADSVSVGRSPPLDSVADRAALYPKRKSAAVASTEMEVMADLSVFKDRVAPVILLVAGLIGRIAQGYSASLTPHPAVAVVMILFDLIVNVAVMLLGAYVAAAVLAVNFGDLATAAVKLAAIAVLVGAVAPWVARIDHDPNSVRGTLLALQVSVLLIFVLIYSLFELDLQEALTTTVIVGVLLGVAMVGMHIAA